jgi:ADP-ribose pyrophosphatase YjhB (NUDIX family)
VAERRVPCVGAIITGPGGLLLIKRGHEPEAGRWSLPGGRVEPGETDHEALAREVREETGLLVTPGPLVGEVERPAAGGRVLVIRDYAATVTGGELAAGDDAQDARWVGARDLQGLSLSSGLEEALYGWRVLPLAPPAALVAEATRRAGVVWLAPSPDRGAYPVWHIWRTVQDTGPEPPPPPGAAYLVTGPGEQPAPGLAGAGQVTVTVPSKDSGGALVTWTAGVRRVEPGSAEWDAVIGPLVAGRLNAAAGPEEPLAARWARSCAVFCLTPVCS